MAISDVTQANAHLVLGCRARLPRRRYAPLPPRNDKLAGFTRRITDSDDEMAAGNVDAASCRVKEAGSLFYGRLAHRKEGMKDYEM